MRAVVCVPGGAEVTTVPDPRPAAGEVVVEVDACGLCGSDVHAIESGQARPGQILGHEFSGHIVELGAGTAGGRRGQPVAVNPLGSCRQCRACRRGLPFRCAARPNLGITAPGGYAEYAAVPLGRLVGDGLRLAGSCAFSYPVYQAAVEHIAAGRVPVASLISERVSLDGAPSALLRLRQPGDLVRVLTRPRQQEDPGRGPHVGRGPAAQPSPGPAEYASPDPGH